LQPNTLRKRLKSQQLETRTVAWWLQPRVSRVKKSVSQKVSHVKELES